jgi:hypothetical protein
MITLLLVTVLTALIAALNPLTIDVVMMSISSLLGKGKHPKHVGSHTASFGAGLFTAYGIAGLAAYWLLRALPIGLVGYVALAVGVALVLFGIVEIKDYFWRGQGFSFGLSAKAESKIHDWTKKHHTHARGFMLGVYTTLRLSHYALILVIGHSVFVILSARYAFALPLLWAGAYMLPVLMLAGLVTNGSNIQNLLSWKDSTRHSMRLSIGLLYVLFGWILITLIAGGIKLG